MKLLRGLVPAIVLGSLAGLFALTPAVLALAGESADGAGTGSNTDTFDGTTVETTWVFAFDAVGTGVGSEAIGQMSLTQTVHMDFGGGATGGSVYVLNADVECLTVDGSTAMIIGSAVVVGPTGAETTYRVIFAVEDNATPGVGVDRFGAIFFESDSHSCGSGASLGDPITAGEITVVDVVDSDGDSVPDDLDNCPTLANFDQANNDGDSQGDACDSDDDNDGVSDTPDNCPTVANASQADIDGDGLGDACDPDNDNDKVPDAIDNCPTVANMDQLNSDADAQGDACDSDDDNDHVPDATDNCQVVFNPDQADTDDDGIGDACDPLIDSDGDLVADAADNCPAVANAGQADADGDGAGDACDAYPNNPNKSERNEKKDKNHGPAQTPV